MEVYVSNQSLNCENTKIHTHVYLLSDEHFFPQKAKSMFLLSYCGSNDDDPLQYSFLVCRGMLMDATVACSLLGNCSHVVWKLY